MRIYIPQNDYYQGFFLPNICFVCLKEMSEGDCDRLLFKEFKNRSYSLNPLCPKFISN